MRLRVSAGENRRVVKSAGSSGEERHPPRLEGPSIFRTGVGDFRRARYLSRSGPMLFTLIMPMIVVFILWAVGEVFWDSRPNTHSRRGAYCLLVMTNMVYNNLGGDGGGIQFSCLPQSRSPDWRS